MAPTTADSFNLTSTLAQFLDPHFVIQLLAFLRQNTSIYAADDLQRAEQQLAIQKTKLYGYRQELLNLAKSGDDQKAIDSLKQSVESELAALQTELQSLLDILNNADNMKELREATVAPRTFSATSSERVNGLAFLKQKHTGLNNLSQHTVDRLYEYARLEFDSGRYEAAADHLLAYRLLSDNVEKGYMSQWGRFAALALSPSFPQDYEVLKSELFELRDLLESSTVHDVVFRKNPLLLLQHRSWLIHWALFAFFRDINTTAAVAAPEDDGADDAEATESATTTEPRDTMIGAVDFFFQDRNFNAIQTNCPHMLRYLTTSLIICGKIKRRNQLRELTKIIEHEQVAYTDPIVKFFEALYVRADFDTAQQQLKECETLFSTDYFLKNRKQDFIDAARTMFFELFCRVHRKAEIKSIAARLNMDEQAAEQWINESIKNNRIKATIDAETKSVILRESQHNAFQQLTDKAENLVTRTNMTTRALDHAIKRQQYHANK